MIRVGPAGWSYDDWAGYVYPTGQRIDRLAYLAEYFDTIEVNSTFYRIPPRRFAESWAHRIRGNPRFVFTVKLPRRFTHEYEKPYTGEEVTQILDSLAPLIEQEKLGALLAQFPWFFACQDDSKQWIDRLLSCFKGYPLVLEMRHRSWVTQAFLDYLREKNVGLANIDLPQSSTSIQPSAWCTSSVGYFRFHGRNTSAWFDKKAGRNEKYDYLYNEAELEEWLERIEAVAQEAEAVYVIYNNHYRGKEAVNALQAKQKLSRTATKVAAPPPLLQHYPELKGYAEDKSSAPHLF